MDNTMRLLRAFIEASGYDISEYFVKDGEKDYKVTKKESRGGSVKRKAYTYSEDFNKFWLIYPKRAGANPKNPAWVAWKKQIRDDADPRSMIEGAERYNKFCVATNKIRTEYIQLPATFLGKNLSYMERWDVPKNTIQLPNDNNLVAYAQKNNLSMPKPGEGMRDYRHRLENAVRS